jgi:DNA-binding MarR family transcriptional regulator
MVDRLADAGLVERRADPADRRAWRLHLTDRAHPILAELRVVADQVMAEAMTGIDAADQQQLAALLGLVRANLAPRLPARDDELPASRLSRRSAQAGGMAR